MVTTVHNMSLCAAIAGAAMKTGLPLPLPLLPPLRTTAVPGTRSTWSPGRDRLIAGEVGVPQPTALEVPDLFRHSVTITSSVQDAGAVPPPLSRVTLQFGLFTGILPSLHYIGVISIIIILQDSFSLFIFSTLYRHRTTSLALTSVPRIDFHTLSFDTPTVYLRIGRSHSLSSDLYRFIQHWRQHLGYFV